MSNPQMRVIQIPALQDNYFYIVACEKTKTAAIIDPCDTKAAKQMVEKHDIEPRWIINTHHHWDHVGGNEDLKTAFGLEVAAAKEDAHRIPGFDIPLSDGDVFAIGELRGRIMATPGHTRTHISIYFEDGHSLFCGDTLFSCGCGRLFEGTAEQMAESLYEKILALPGRTQVFCGHEYTQGNISFASTIEPANLELKNYAREVARMRHKNKSTIPTTLEREKAINPFLRCGINEELQETLTKKLGYVGEDRLSLFTALRKLKDHF